MSNLRASLAHTAVHGAVSLIALSLSVVAGCGGSSTQEQPLDPVTSPEDASVVSDATGPSNGFEAGIDGGPTCVPRTCADVGANCGPVADGCGGLTASCGTCAAGQICGGGGTPSVCGTSVGDGGGCVPQTCEKAGAICGPIGDGCGGTLDCGTCPAGLSCGGGGSPSVCGVVYVPESLVFFAGLRV